MNQDYKSGFISIIGRPNVGKSTLINSLVGKKILSTSPRPQFTRRRINCILTLPTGQLIFIDTPGINRPLDELGKFMLSQAYSTFHDVDIILLVMDATSRPGPGDGFIARKLQGVTIPIFLVVNKIDAVKKNLHAERINAYRKFQHQEIQAVSAREGTGILDLTTAILDQLPPGPQYYPDDMLTDNLDQVIMADMIREQVFSFTREEVPYAVEVVITQMKEREREGLLEIYAVIFVERSSQKGILIGQGGEMLKRIGQRARSRIEDFFATRVYLDLWVKVKKDWRDRKGYLKEFGYRR